MFYQDGLTGSAWGDWSLYTDSPLRAVIATDEAGRDRFVTGGAADVALAPGTSTSGLVWEGEIGATYPLCNRTEGMSRWDPCGFTAGKNADKFDQYRRAE